jgi:hypothetical protein
MADRVKASNGFAAAVAEDIAFDERLFANIAGRHSFLNLLESALSYLDSK